MSAAMRAIVPSTRPTFLINGLIGHSSFPGKAEVSALDDVSGAGLSERRIIDVTPTPVGSECYYSY
jgi:hypothetical protein